MSLAPSSLLSGPTSTSTDRWLVVLLLVFALIPRLAVYPTNENLFGDAIPRTELAEQWAQSPHVIRSFADGPGQFGPLHLYLIGAALQVFGRADAGRAVSLLFGVLTILPLFMLTRRYFGSRAAVWACLGFSVWGLHVQFSTTAGSEAVSICLLFVAFACLARALETHRLWFFAWAAVAMNLACALRYDAWLYVPLLALMPLLQWRDRMSGLWMGVVFGLLCLPFPLLWMWGNALASGDPFYPMTYINAYHRAWAASYVGAARVWGLRAEGIGFWPAMALFTLTPGVAFFGAAGMIRAWREVPAVRWVVVATLAPVAYYAFRTAVLLNFVPLARFVSFQIALLLPFVSIGFSACASAWGRDVAGRVAIASAGLAIAMPLALGLYTFRADGYLRDILRSLSPTSSNPRSIIVAANFLKRQVSDKGGAVALDSDPRYMDLPLEFYAEIPEARLVRLRWPDFRQRVEQERPAFVVRFDRGDLANQKWVRIDGRTLWLGAGICTELAGFTAPVHVHLCEWLMSSPEAEKR
jgi:4-amino-4-deoxy-L-arabinose transferase-like glycosyltransferase